ncbi:MAG: hypothetical protein V1901_03830 [Patescibacteria group bacterium]
MSVSFILYQSNGSTLIFTFPVVISANYPHSEKRIIEHENLRGKGSIITEGGEIPWTLDLRGVLFAEDYNSLMSLVDSMETTVALNVPYYIKITKSLTTTWDYKCKRLEPIKYTEDSLRTNFLEYQVSLRCLSW